MNLWRDLIYFTVFKRNVSNDYKWEVYAELELVDLLIHFLKVSYSVSCLPRSHGETSQTCLRWKDIIVFGFSVFALHNYKPTQFTLWMKFLLLISRMCPLLLIISRTEQKTFSFIVISLRNNMFELAERLVGIYKNEDMTKSTTIENFDFFSSVKLYISYVKFIVLLIPLCFSL